MFFLRCVSAVCVLILMSATLATAQRVETLFYTIDNEDCFLSFKANIKSIDIVGPQCYKMDEHGIIAGSVDSRILDLAKKHAVKVMPLVINPGFDQPSFHSFLHDSLARLRAVSTMLRLCQENKFYGIQFDFENIHVKDRDLYTEFYRQAASRLRANGFAISIAVVPRSSDNAGPTEYHRWNFENWSGAFDYKSLGEIGDFVSLMTYSQHTPRTPPGPVAGLPWMEAVIQFVLQGVPASKISLGLPFYSHQWQAAYRNNNPLAWGRTLDYKEARGIADRYAATWQWDDRDKVYYTFYSNEGLNEYLYLEDARSFTAKMALVKKYHFRGISVWRLGHEDPDVWKQLLQSRQN
jgi:spore germination protein